MAKASASKGTGFRRPGRPDPKFSRFMTEERSRNARDFLAGYPITPVTPATPIAPEDNPIHVGRMVRKVKSDRVGQISAITDTHAVIYWPDFEEHRNNPAQTYVRVERFRRAREWELL